MDRLLKSCCLGEKQGGFHREAEIQMRGRLSFADRHVGPEEDLRDRNDGAEVGHGEIAAHDHHDGVEVHHMDHPEHSPYQKNLHHEDELVQRVETRCWDDYEQTWRSEQMVGLKARRGDKTHCSDRDLDH